MVHKEQNKLKTILYADSSFADNGSMFRTIIPWLMFEARNRGINAEYLNIDDVFGFCSLIGRIREPNVLIHTGIWAYDVRIQAFSKYNNVDPYEGANATLVAAIGDHPFTQFMHQRVVNASSNFRYETLCNVHRAVMEEMSNSKLSATLTTAVPTPPINEQQLPGFSDRPISFFFPMSISYPVRDIGDFLSQMPTFLYEKVRELFYDYRYEFLLTSYEYFKVNLGLGAESDSLRASLGDRVYFSLLSIISEADFRERFRWRFKRLVQIANELPNMSIICAGEKPKDPMSLPINVKFTGWLDFPTLLRFYASSKAVVHCHPTYFDGLHERPIHAQSLGCVLVTDDLPWTSRLVGNSFVSLPLSGDTSLIHDLAALTKWPDYLRRLTNNEVSESYGTKALILQHQISYLS